MKPQEGGGGQQSQFCCHIMKEMTELAIAGKFKAIRKHKNLTEEMSRQRPSDMRKVRQLIRT